MERFVWIDNYVFGLIDLYCTNDVYGLYKYLDIQIVKISKDSTLFQGDNDAVYQRNFFDEEIVFIRSDLNYKYEKFVLAHELGHAVLHVETYKASFNKKLLKYGKLERQANYFAIKLLDINVDPIKFEGWTLEQISSSLCIPKGCLKSFKGVLI